MRQDETCLQQNGNNIYSKTLLVDCGQDEQCLFVGSANWTVSATCNAEGHGLIMLNTHGRIAYDAWQQKMQIGGERLELNKQPERRSFDPKPFWTSHIRATIAETQRTIMNLGAALEKEPHIIAKRFTICR